MAITKGLFEKQLGHRTIREFEEKEIPVSLLEQLLEVANRTASSNGMQQCSIIHVTDQAIKNAIAEVAMQDYISKVPTLLIFIVDQYRNAQLAIESCGEATYASDTDKFLQGYTDAAIAAQNVTNAAESVGLGAMYMGSILNDAEKICDLLKLPELTFPVVGLGLGYPNQSPQLKPRMAKELKVFENQYTLFDSYTEVFSQYDEEIQSYYDLRLVGKRSDSFSKQAAMKMNHGNPMRQDLLKIARKQGFMLRT